MFVAVRLIKPWAGQPAGTILRLAPSVAERLVSRRQAVREMRAEDIECAVIGPAELAMTERR
jgi:hypothetical protein